MIYYLVLLLLLQLVSADDTEWQMPRFKPGSDTDLMDYDCNLDNIKKADEPNQYPGGECTFVSDHCDP